MLDYLRTVLAAHLPKRDERGASAVEYGLLIAGIAALIVVVVFAFGDNIDRHLPETATPATASATGGCHRADPASLHGGRERNARGHCDLEP